MKFLIDIDLKPKDGGEQFTVEQVLTHLREYTFPTEDAYYTEFELSLIPGDPDHETGTDKDYRIFTIERSVVTPVSEGGKKKLTFINDAGLTFTATEGEVGLTSMEMLDYIKYCLDLGSILVKVEDVS